MNNETQHTLATDNERLRATNAVLLAALKMAAELVKVSRRHFPKSMQHADSFQLENTNAAIGAAIARAEEATQ